MRTGMKKLARLMTIIWTFVGGFLLLVVFQNCGGMAGPSLSDAFSSDLMALCLGVNCQRDLNAAILKTNTTEILIDNGADSAACDAANCFDVAGYCETGGYPSSVFTYQWTLAGQSPQAEVRTTSSCDSLGRFHLQVHIPPGFDRTKIHSLRIQMKIQDESRAEFTNPTGANAWSYSIRTRS